MKKSICSLAVHVSTGILFSVVYSASYGQSVSEARGLTAIPEVSRIELSPMAPNGKKVKELSALAWDADEQLLYALSDKGTLFHYEIALNGNEIRAAQVKYAASLTTDDERSSEDPSLNAEGLTLLHANNGRTGDTELIVVAENSRQFLHFTPQGVLKRKVELPHPLNNPDSYQRANRGLEAVGRHPQHGLLAAPEAPLKGAPASIHTLYSGHRTWSIPKYAEKARLKDLAALPDGNLMILERSREAATKLLVASLRYVDLSRCDPDGICKAKEMIVLPASEENFEGLAHLRANQFLLVSDKSGKGGQGGTLLLITLP